MKVSVFRPAAFVLGVALVVGSTSFLLEAEPPQPVDTWASVGTADPQAARTGAAVATLADGTTLVAGGLTGQGAATDSVVIHDPLANSSTQVGHLQVARVHAAATRLDDGRVLITGGDVSGLINADVEIFDPATGESEFVALLIAPRTGHASALLDDGTVLIVGGTTIDGVVLNTTERFDPATNSVTASEPMTVARTRASATTLIDGRVLVAGGNDGAQDLTSAEIYSPIDAGFLPVPTQMSQARSGHIAVLLPHNNSVLVAGGTSAASAVATTDLFLPAMFPDPYSWGMGSFGPTNPMVQPRSHAVAGPWGDDGYAFAMGGGSGDGEVYRFATIKTDKDDYAPGEFAVITGSGWQPGEVVKLVFQEDPAVHDDYVIDGEIVADDEGNIFHNQWAPEEHDLGIRFYLMATGMSSHRRAQTTFTDGTLNNVSVGTQSPLPITPGGSAEYTVSVDMAGNGNACTITLSAAATGSPAWPVGASFSFSGTNPIALLAPDGNVDFTRGLTVNMPVGTTPATYNFTVTASPSSSPSCGGSTKTASGTVVVGSAVVTTTGVSSSLNPSTYGNSVSFTAVVTRAAGSGAPTGTVQFRIDGSNFGSAVEFSSITSTTATAVSGSISSLTAATHTVEAVYVPTGSFAASADLLDGGQVVNKATPAATLVVSNSPQTYTGSGLAAAVDISVSSVPGAVANILTGGAATQITAGTYAVTADFVPTDTTNYQSLLGLAAGNFTIDKATPTATLVVSNSPQTYTGSGLAAAVDISVSSVPGTVTNILTGGTAAQITAGTYAVTADFMPTDTTNYQSLPGLAAGNFTIDKATATVVVNPYDVTYDGNPHTAAVVSITGVNGETGATVGTVDVSNTTHTDAGTYTSDSWSFTGTANYNDIAPTTITNEIDKANATVVVNPYDVTYDGTPHTATVVSITGVNGETDATVGTVDVSNTTHTDAGTYATDSWSFTGTANYNDIAPTTITDEIAQADANVSITPYSGTYDAASHNLTGSVVGVAGDLTAVGSSLTFGTSYTDAGNHIGSWTFEGGTNYLDESGTAAITIGKANATVTVTPYNVQWDGNPHTATYSIAGVAGQTGATVGAVDVSNTTHTLTGTYATDYWFFTGASNYNNIGNTTITDVITTGYCFNGFLSPIGGAVENIPSNGGSYADPVRAFKLGSTIPVKFILNAKSGNTCGSVVTTGVHTLEAIYYSSAVDSEPPVDASPTDVATTGNQFRLTGTEWHFNLSTKGGGFKAGTWLLKATLYDGSVKTVWITIKK